MAYTAHSNSKYDRIKEIKKIKDGAYYAAITCESHGCPLFSRCSQFASMGKKTSRAPIKLFFVFDAPDQGDVNEGVAAVSDAGMYFRNNWLNPFIQLVGATSYLITHLVRTPIVDAKNHPRAALASEAAYCWEHFWRDMMEYKPKALIVFGPQVFQQLYQKAINKEALPDAEAQNIIKLRKNSYKMQFTADYSVDVFVGYAPSYILRSPNSKHLFTEDMNHVVNYISPGKMDLSKQKIEIDKIDLIDTVDGALDFIDFLTRGLPQNEMFDLAFDTETDDLNRVFNNKFLSWQFSYKPGHAVFIPIEHPEKPIFADIKIKLKLIAAFQNLLNSSPEQTRIAWILAHNAKFDLSVLYGLYRILPRGSIPIWDTLLAMHWLDENRKSAAAGTSAKPYSLKTLGKEFFSLKNEQGKWVEFEYKSEALAARADGDLVNLSFDALVEYGGTDTILTWHLKQEQMRQANLQKGNALEKLDRFMRHYYSPASRAIAFMECNGLHVSKEQLQYLQGEESPIWNRIDRIEKIDLQTAPEVLDFKDEYKNIILGTNISYEDDLWGNDNTSDSELVFNPNKKDQETPFYLEFLKLTPLALSKKTDKPTLNKEFLNHYASREEYLTLPSVAPYVSYYTTPLSYDEEGDPVFPKNPLQLILELRELSKLGNTYLKGIGDMIGDKKGDCIDGRVRASYWMSGCDTGRVSSSSPNLQNLPSGRTPMAKEVKNLFQAEPPSKKFPEGTVLLQLDYKTAEVRWAAIFANDQNLIRVFKEARESLIAACAPDSTMSDEEFEATQLASDIHRRTASLMFNVSPKDVSKSMRQAVKSITFGILFGMGTQTLAKNNGWTENEAEEKIEMFYSAFPQLRDWLERNPKIAERDGYVETIMGRRRRLHDLYAVENFRTHAKASRLAKNAPIQGQSSDGGNIGLINFFQFLLDNNLEKKWLIQNIVHDSCLVQVPMADLEKALEAMQYHFVEGMADYIKKYFNFTLPLPIECEIEVGLKYGDLTKWDGRPSTLPGVREKLKEDAKKLWSKKEDTGKPPSDFDLIPWCGK
jgi:uracil-DNA glycosylase family 4